MRERISRFAVAGVLFLALCIVLGSGDVASGKTKKPAVTKAKITFLEIGSVNCTPCRMMKPVMKEIEKKYDGKVVVVFYDITRMMGSMVAEKYGVRMIPTQVFLDEKGKEFFRHTGFYPASEISKIIDKKLGKNAGNI